ncbi:uncharacterized protein MKZ38_006260 [Zalerion maritima]|uniref:Uncharacterized protein n=1 Tax=Zalerion maritima TaxID=339359 RepID=A0AAD5RP46_9PEZI|nr:uncharacterized protein MKZ38_006260 [Zalerion maritima]
MPADLLSNIDNASTARWCQAGLAASVLVAVASLVGGGVCLVFQLQDGQTVFFSMPWILREIIPLLINLLITLLTESMGYIHGCSLRWALFREGRLEYNSNLRLLSFSRKNTANTWYCNLVYFIGMVLSYASTSLIFLSFNPELAETIDYDFDIEDRSDDDIHINGIALLTLGTGLLLQAAIAGWCLAGKKNIITWSSNPLTVAKACLQTGGGAYPVEYQSGKCMMSVHMRKDDYPNGVNPTMVQRPMTTGHPHIKWVFGLLWPLPAVLLGWGLALHFTLMNGTMEGVHGTSWSFIPKFTGNTDNSCDAVQCTDGTSILNLSWTQYTTAVGTIGAVFMIAGFQAIVTLALHISELIIDLSRDEKTYRELSSVAGTNPKYRSIKVACNYFPSIFLFVMKACVHWVFGLACSLNFMLGVNMYPPQILYLAGFTLGLAAFCTYLALRRPTGFLPASFGHIQTIVNIVDDWLDAEAIFWGHKADADDDGKYPAFAGTSATWLEDPNPKDKYGGPRRENDKHQIVEAANKASVQRRKETLGRESQVASRRESLATSRRQTLRSVSTFDNFPATDKIRMSQVNSGSPLMIRPHTGGSTRSGPPSPGLAPPSPALEPPQFPPSPLRRGSDFSYTNSLTSHHSQASFRSSYSMVSGASQRPLMPPQHDYEQYRPPYIQQKYWSGAPGQAL